MNVNWTEIKSQIKVETNSILTPADLNGLSVDECITLFQKVIYAPQGGFHLGGLGRSLPIALDEALNTNVGSLNPLKIVADSLEPYLKKIAVICPQYSEQDYRDKQLIGLLKLLRLSVALSDQQQSGLPNFSENNAHEFVGKPELLEYIRDAYLIRNKVHESPNLSKREVLKYLTSLIIVYLKSVAVHAAAIETLPDWKPTSMALVNQFSEDERHLYHFVTFGTTTNHVRNQIVIAYIVHQLHKNKSQSIVDIQHSSNNFFQTNMSLPYYEKLVEQLRQENKIVHHGSRMYSLTPNEDIHINNILSDFEDNRNIFLLFLEDIGKKYNISSHLPQLLNKLQVFIENNYSIDINEAFNAPTPSDKDQDKLFLQLFDYLTSITDKEIATNLFKDLAGISKDSDFLLRLSAGKTIANLTNPDRFEQYINLLDKEVYLDSQILLHALCLNYVPAANFNNFYYQTTEELISLAKTSNTIKLKISKYYLKEVAYQLKLALMLIPFEEMEIGNLSQNIFYQFFQHLKKYELLEEGDETFADFMQSWFHLYENDAYSPSFHAIAIQNIQNWLGTPDLPIALESFPTYENKYEAVKTIEGIIEDENLRFRPKQVIDNDALMLCHLSNSDVHEVEPFFLTWDKGFTKFRKEFLSTYQRANALSFHLFTPSRFINHYSLMRLKINPQALTNDLLSIMDSFSIHEKTLTIWDSINKFLNFDSINPQKRRRYITTIKEILEQELDYDTTHEDKHKSERMAINLDETLARINDYFSNTSKYSMNDYKDVLLSDDYFDQAASLIAKSLAETEFNIVIELDKLIVKFKEDANEQINAAGNG